MSTPNSFITPSTKRIDLADGRWIEVKGELDVADQRRMDALALVPVRLDDGTVVDRVDWGIYEILRTHLWVTGWGNFCGADGKTRPYSLDALKALDPDIFDEVNNAVYDHIMALLVAKKKKREMQQANQGHISRLEGAATST
jgi:hypothetical protein